MRAEEKTLYHFLFAEERTKYSVPYYQRPYAWKKDQIENFWTDLTDDKQNFIGPIVIHEEVVGKDKKDKKIYNRTIVDGQQRLITSTIFACVLRDHYKRLNAIKHYIGIHSRYIVATDDSLENEVYRLEAGEITSKFLGPYLQDDDHVSQFKRIKDLYEDKINSKGEIISEEFFNKAKNEYNKAEADNTELKKKISELNSNTPEQKRIRDNYILLYSRVFNFIKNCKDDQEKINQINYLRDDLRDMQIVVITIDDLQSAWEVFERLNNYGVPLTQADLLKNYLLKKVKEDEIATCHKKWIQVEERVGNDKITSFIRYYWMSKYKFTQLNKLYSSISSQRGLNYKNFLNDLDKASEIYETIVDPASSFEGLKTEGGVDFSNKINDLIKTMNSIGITQPITFLLSIVSLAKEKRLRHDPSKFLSLLENFLFQYFAIGNNPGNAVERLFSKISNDLEATIRKPPKHVQKEQNKCFTENSKNILKIYNEYVNEDSFYEAFMELKYSRIGKKYNINRYILEKYEYYLWETKGKVSRELDIKLNSVNQEHLLPQQPKAWGLNKSEVKDYVNSLGNIFLIDVDLNRKMSNDKLDKKIKELKKSKLESVNFYVRKYNRKPFEWNKSEIDKRLNAIAKAGWENIWKI